MTKKTETTKKSTKGKNLTGVVTSNKMKDTIVVEISRYVKHAKYGKFITLKKKIKAHDAGNTKEIGETVTITETKPMSKDKSFILSNS